MSTWIAQHFLNPAYFWPGVALIAAPIIIHLINRLRYRRVRFAAMEFLLASEQRNRKRILFEQLLLLLLRIAMVLLLLAIIGRLVLDAAQLTLFQGAKAHHVVLLDDSGSMRDRIGETSAFDQAREVIRKIVNEGAGRPGTQKFTLLLLSRPDETLSGLSERDIDEPLVDEVAARLDNLSPTFQSFSLTAGLDAARARLADDRAAQKHLHVVSDFRRTNWFDDAGVAAAVASLDEADVAVNLVRTVGESHDNLAVTALTGSVETAAAGVPVTFTAKAANFGTREAEDVRLAVAVDGRPLPMNLILETIAAGEEAAREFAVIFETAGKHRLQVSLESDALEQDNIRYVAIDVPEENPVLIIDGTPGTEQGIYIADALAADTSITGFAATIDAPEYLRKSPLDRFHAIYMVNVPELPDDALDALQKFVAAGGGLAWFLGDAVRPAFYNDKLFQEGEGLFPARLANAPATLPRDDGTSPGPDIVIGDAPMFRILAGEENPFIDTVFVNEYYPLDPAWLADRRSEAIGVTFLASLRNRQPLMLEHTYGQGRIVTCLTAAGPLETPQGEQWNNWANGPGAPSYAVLQLELARHIARRDRNLPQQSVGEPLRATLARAVYRDEVEIVTPDNQATQLKAEAMPAAEGAAEEAAVRPLQAVYRETDAPGIYTIRLQTQTQQPEERLVAYNVPVDEGRLNVATDDEIRRQLGDAAVTIQSPGMFDWIRSESAGQEIRWWLLLALIALGVCEQALAYRLSYHPV